MKTYRERTQDILEKTRAIKKKRRRIAVASALSCALAFVIAFNLFLFVPYSTGGYRFNLAAYTDSEYYSVIEKLSGLVVHERAPVVKSNFDRWFGDNLKGGSDWGMADGADTSPPSTDAPGSSQGGEGSLPDSYKEVTDNQVEGVIEGDLFKRGDNTLFYLSTVSSGYMLRAYSIAGEDSALIAEYSVNPENGVRFAGYADQREMYLSEDVSTVTIVTPCFDSISKLRYTAIIGVDVSDPANMHTVRTSYVSGQCVSSRIQGETMLVISNFNVNSDPDFRDEKQFLPQVGTRDEMKTIPLENIVLPEKATSARYTVLTTLDAETAELVDSLALLSYSDEAYISRGNIYATRTFYENVEETVEDHVSNLAYYRTEISRVAYFENGELSLGAQATVNGTVNNRYSMDEYEGTFRLFTTVQGGPYLSNSGYWSRRGSSASLYVLNVNDLSLRTSVERFAPESETVQSARFQGNKAYVCTAIVVTDPVFIFDLSDLDNIAYKRTEDIPGYSISLADFTGGTLLGIGYDETRSLKIEIYEETANTVESKASVVLRADFSTEYKAYFIDREHGFVGLAMEVYTNYGWRYEYRLFQFDGYELVEIANIPLEGSYGYNEARAFFADGWLYVVDVNNFKVLALG